MKVLPWMVMALGLAGCGELANGPAADIGSASAPLSKLSDEVAARVLESDFQTSFRVVNSWGTGYQGELTVTYRGQPALPGWSLEFDLPAQITSLWNGTIASRTGNRYRVTGAAYNADLSSGQSVTLGFVANFSGALVEPTSFALNDSGATTAPVPSPTPPVVGGLTGTFQLDSRWTGGFVGRVLVRNATAAPVSDWRLQLRLPGGVANLWNGVVVSQSAGLVHVGPQTYNRTIAAGQTIEIGFQGNGEPTVTEIGFGNVVVVEPSPSPTPPPPTPPAPVAGFLHTQGARIVNDQNQTVLLRGVNWFGMETNTFCPHGLWARSLDSMLDQIAGLGYNCLRLPFSNELLRATAQPNGIDFALNPDLRGLTGLQIMDKVIEKAGARGLKVILDRHRPDSSGQSELWYDARCSEQQWLTDWETLARRYRSNPTVAGFDLHNEPHGAATWGDGNTATDWRLAAEKAGNRILAVHPNALIVVEGIERDDSGNTWWGGALGRARQAPIRLSVAGHLVYSPHDYPASVFPQSWFSASSYPSNLAALWDTHWGYLAKSGTAPILLGEFGTKHQTQSDRQWMQTLVTYLQANQLSCTFWSWNPNSGDTGGILQDDWKTVQSDKQQALQPLLNR